MASPLQEQGGHLTPEQKHVVKEIITIGRKRFKSPKARHQAIITALITGAQEAGLTNPKTESGGSKGWRQELTQYYSNPTNLVASVNRFYDEYKHEAGSGSLGERAQNVQASAYPEAYTPHIGEARTILKQFNRSHRGGRQTGAQGASGGTAAKASQGKQITIPGKSYASDRKMAALQLINSRFEPGAFEQYASTVSGLQDVPSKTVNIPGLKTKGKEGKKLPKEASGKEMSADHTGKWEKKYGVPAAHLKGTPLYGSAVDIGRKVADMFGLTVTSVNTGSHVSGSYHYQNRAIDISGSSAAMRKAFVYIAKHVPHSKLTELFYDPIGHYFDNGSKVSGAIGGHSDHVHLAI